MIKKSFEIKLEEEAIPLLIVFKKDGVIHTKVSPDTLDFELYGFLKLYVERMELQLYDSIIDAGEE